MTSPWLDGERKVGSGYGSARGTEETLVSLGILILRLVVGFTMAAHGAQKMFGWFEGPGFSGMSSGIKQMGFRPARLYTVLISVAELGGGLLLAAGFLTPLGAAAVIGTMIAAIAVVHWPNGFFSGKGGYELNLLLIAASAAIAFAGPGSYSVDHLLGWMLYGSRWGLFCLAAGVVAGAGVLATRHRPPSAGGLQTDEPASQATDRTEEAA
jgi:putative oxidoreductase